jgi:hypothetical protein
MKALERILDKLAGILDFGAWLHRLFWKIFRVDRFEAVGNELLLHKNPWRVRVLLSGSEVVSWEVIPEMAFDIVDVHLSDGTSIRLLDEFGDCISGLERIAGEKRKKM